MLALLKQKFAVFDSLIPDESALIRVCPRRVDLCVSEPVLVSQRSPSRLFLRHLEHVTLPDVVISHETDRTVRVHRMLRTAVLAFCNFAGFECPPYLSRRWLFGRSRPHFVLSRDESCT